MILINIWMNKLMYKNILILNMEVMDYNFSFYKYLAKKNFKVTLVHYDKIEDKNTPFELEENLKNPKTIKKSKLNFFNFKNLLNNNFELVLVSGWTNILYLVIAYYFKFKYKSKLIISVDNYYKKSLRQKIGIYILKTFLFYKLFNYCWIPSSYHSDLVTKIGFKRRQILNNLYSADTDFYSSMFNYSIKSKEINYPKNLLFVGRLEKVKGLDLLIEAWNLISNKKGWTLTIVGNGSLDKKLTKINDCNFIPFSNKNDLLKIANNSGFFILPSRYEPWGVVIHEFVSAGLPVICSKNCGSSKIFVQNNINGYIIQDLNVFNLTKFILKIIDLPKEKLLKFSYNSFKNCKKINYEKNYYNLLSLFNETI
tara:strand:+ start:1516 stop:2619 length:1104 start_codon:yes stop_codon:yes gene_type:complete